MLQVPLSYSIFASLLAVGVIAIAMWVFYKKAVNKAVKAYTHKLPHSPEQLNTLINSLNDIIFEFDEEKVCRNVWFNDLVPRAVDPRASLNKKLDDIIGPERAKKFNDAIQHVIDHQEPTSLEYVSEHGTGKWFIARVAPVFDREGNYLNRVSASVTDISEQKKYSNELIEKEHLLLEAQKVAKIGNWFFDRTTRETYLSANMLTILGTPAIPTGIEPFDHYISLVHPDDKATCIDLLTNIATNNWSEFEHRIITNDGSLKYIRIIIGVKTLTDEGSLQRVSGIIQDVTDIRLSEKTIKKGRSELIEAQTIAKIGNWSWSMANGKLACSDEIANIFEIAPTELNDTKVQDILLKLVHPNDIFILQHLIKSAATVPNYTCVLRIITPNDTIKYISTIVGKVLTNEDGSPRKIIGTLQDITDRKQVEIDYKRTENKYKLVLETIKMVALSLNTDGTIIFCNQYLANLLGYDQKDLLGLNWFDHFIPENIRPTVGDLLYKNDVPQHYINAVICKNGEERIISWQNTVSYDGNGLIKETTSIGEDITDQQKATQELISAKELAERSSKFKSDFLSVMSHEIRTPMNAVIGTTNLLLSEDPKPEQLEYLNILRFSGENLLAIINDILDYNKIEAGKLDLNPQKFSIHQLVQKTQQSFRSRANDKNLVLELNIDKRIPEFVIGDQIRLSQILNNLISNAIKFTERGKVNIKLETVNHNGGNVHIKFTVADTGIGIAPEHHSLIFDPFIQEPYVNHNNAGTGLGLAITKRLVNLHKSDISVVSSPGNGAEFIFVIAFELPKVGDQPEQAAHDHKAMPDIKGMKILVVDDNKMNLLIAKRFLTNWQANVDEALNGQLAVDMAAAKVYDLVIMDLQMPVMDGFEATEIIKTTQPDLPIIALTADAMPETYTKALDAGMVDYLTKPFVPAVFFEKVARYYGVRSGVFGRES